MPPALVAAIQRYDQPTRVVSVEATRREINRLWLARAREKERGNVAGARYLIQRIRRAEQVQRAHRRAEPYRPAGTDAGLVWWAKMWNAPG